MTDRVLEHQISVLLGKVQDVYDTMPEWKKKLLMVKVDEAFEVITSTDRRNQVTRRVNGHGR